MSTKTILAALMTVGVLGIGSLGAQEPTYPNQSGTVPGPEAASEYGPIPTPIAGERAELSDWITYGRRSCCLGPVGGHGCVQNELYVRSGVDVLIGGEFLSQILNTGWIIQGGGRSLFFNPESTRAWVVDMSLSNTANSSSSRNIIPTLITDPNNNVIIFTPATLRSFNRTFVNLGGGQEWWLQPACAPGSKWRFGWDAGGRYGSASARFNEERQISDVIGGVWASVHTDLEIPCGCCVFVTGFRTEWAYTWSDIFMLNPSNIQELNLLANIGVRY